MGASLQVTAIALAGIAAFVSLIGYARSGLSRSRLTLDWFGKQPLSEVSGEELRRQETASRVWGVAGVVSILAVEAFLVALIGRAVVLALTLVWFSGSPWGRAGFSAQLAFCVAAFIIAPVAMWTVFATDAKVIRRARESRDCPQES